MKTVMLFVCVVIYASVANKPSYKLSDAPALYVQFIKANNRTFENTYDLLFHYDVFVKNLKDIIEFNEQTGPNHYKDLSVFADRTQDEVLAKLG